MKNQTECLNFLECLDLDETVYSNQDELSHESLPYTKVKELGQSAVDAAQRGYYINSDGTKIDWRIHVENACKTKISISPDDPLPESPWGNKLSVKGSSCSGPGCDPRWGPPLPRMTP